VFDQRKYNLRMNFVLRVQMKTNGPDTRNVADRVVSALRLLPRVVVEVGGQTTAAAEDSHDPALGVELTLRRVPALVQLCDVALAVLGAIAAPAGAGVANGLETGAGANVLSGRGSRCRRYVEHSAANVVECSTAGCLIGDRRLMGLVKQDAARASGAM
jgi:hypothetical protein